MLQNPETDLSREEFAELLQQQAEQLQQQAEQLQQQQEQIYLVVFGTLIPLIVVFIFLFFVVYRSRREAAFRKREFELQLARSGMEMRALRSQVNPHFIFNCLASIQNFVANNNNKEAEYYLVRFSSLIRQVLENSTEKMVSIADDLDALLKYVEMEKLRLNQGFEFDLQIDQGLDQDETFIPPLIIQPLVENAIWHGVNGESAKGKIDVRLEKIDDSGIRCAVRNNTTEKELVKKTDPAKKKSLGLSLIRERLELLNSLYNRNDSLVLKDIEIPEKSYFGKEVSMVIPCEVD